MHFKIFLIWDLRHEKIRDAEALLKHTLRARSKFSKVKSTRPKLLASAGTQDGPSEWGDGQPMFPEDPSGRSYLFHRPFDFKAEDMSLETQIDSQAPSEMPYVNSGDQMLKPEGSSEGEFGTPKLHRLKAFLLEDGN